MTKPASQNSTTGQTIRDGTDALRFEPQAVTGLALVLVRAGRVRTRGHLSHRHLSHRVCGWPRLICAPSTGCAGTAGARPVST